MTDFPQTVHFTGTNTPVGIEWSASNLEVTGTIPEEIDGAFFRAVPDPAHAPMFEDEIALSADGMIAKFDIHGGHVDYAIKFVETERYALEKAARKALFGRYRNPYTDDPSVAGKDRTVANTTPVWHAGRLLMTKEDGLGYEIDPETLETLGRFDYYGALKSQTFTAHPRIDPVTGEMFFFGYEAGGLASLDVAYGIADKHGNLVSEQWFKQPYCSTIHDFLITERYAIFPIFPTTADLDRIAAGGPHWAHQQELESWVGIMPRYGKVEEMRWFKGPKGVSAFHFLNAYEEGDFVHLDVCLSDTCAFPFMREAGGVDRAQQDVGGGLTRWSFDMGKPGESFESRVIGPPGDMPRIPDASQGRLHRKGWYLTINPQGGPPVLGGPVGVSFNMLLQIEPSNGRIEALPLGPGMAINEPVHVPSADPEKEGWLLTVVDKQVGENRFDSELWVIDAGAIAAGPVARVAMPMPMRAQVHGWWVSRQQLDQAKARREPAHAA
ncbi:carotenoid oxygenase family protein [Novosphingobium sp. 1949]|uniref:Dioxygenase n=1 Tax=Novosphingobium organovorum TaxID=2930092 RepID=A0ABT0BAG2_9SPHN|nr:carotenoid oxygenase family protein [Novosphingobium organovorum]MCJ2181801.1 carotenoid oxygenase family protein [Novosphingobium organovorum]